jgi:hypothetical protein
MTTANTVDYKELRKMPLEQKNELQGLKRCCRIQGYQPRSIGFHSQWRYSYAKESCFLR